MKKNILPLIIIFSVFIVCGFFLNPARAGIKAKTAPKPAAKPAIAIKIATTTEVVATTTAATSAPAVKSQVATVAPAKAKTATTAKAKTATVVAKAKTATTAKAKTTSSPGVQWTTSGLNAIGSLASFDYNRTIRNAYIAKVENYARRNGIKSITASVVNSMHE